MRSVEVPLKISIEGVDKNKLAGLLRRTFGSEDMENFQKYLAWQYYRMHCEFGINSTGVGISSTVLHTFVKLPSIADLWIYVEHLLSCVE